MKQAALTFTILNVVFQSRKCFFLKKKSLNSSKIATLKQRHAFERDFVFKLAPVVLYNH